MRDVSVVRHTSRVMGDTRDALTLWFAPALGSALAQVMFLSPFPEIERCKTKRSLGHLNALPYPFVAANCAAWMIYGGISGNYWVYIPNFTGYFCGTYYSFVAYALDEKIRGTMERIVAVLIILVSFIGMVVSCVMKNSSESARLVVAGILANLILVVYYSAPLSTMAEVVRTKDSKSMHFPLVFCNGLNGLCWTTYGIALNDWWIAAPNLFGSVLSIVQVVLIFLYPSSERLRSRITPTPSVEGLVSMSSDSSPL